MAGKEWQKSLKKIQKGSWSFEGSVDEESNEIRLEVDRNGKDAFTIVANPLNAFAVGSKAKALVPFHTAQLAVRVASAEAADWLQEAFRNLKLNALPDIPIFKVVTHTRNGKKVAAKDHDDDGTEEA